MVGERGREREERRGRESGGLREREDGGKNEFIIIIHVCVCTMYMANSFNCITTSNYTYIACTMKTLTL